MSKATLNPGAKSENADAQWQKLCTASGVVVLIQLVLVVISLVMAFTMGREPETAEGYVAMFQANRFEALLRLDFATLIQLSLFPITAMGIYAALRKTHSAYAVLAASLVIVGITLALASNSGLSMIRLVDRYELASTAAQREQLLAAAEAVISADMWHSTAGFMSGLFMQGGLAFISAVMLRSKRFSKVTAITGLVANGLDWLHVPVALLAPSLAIALLGIAAPAYLLWFPMLGRDLLRLGRGDAEREPVSVSLPHPAESVR